MSTENNHISPGTAKPAKLRKAACGIRFEEDELQEGVDFSGAAELKPVDEDESQERPPSGGGKHRQPHRHP
ncbi:hypothetical protein [Marinobacter sp. F4206]|uniref:hypothetical protein n=1 Tax=Marinobacter sp. F4206 TaxID=2861777 RepID=UPI001C605E7B|nr:hypothetical protein [Marinobacter sp. F4206]MBW4933983.1 hypothetical protein [Marinobacter sp. F4206]